MLPDDDDGTTIIADDTEPEIIDVVSARSAFPFVQRWVVQYNNEASSGRVEIGYYLDEPQFTGDLAIVGKIPNTTKSRYIPISAQAAAIVYNIPSFPDIPSGLKLNANVLAQIFNGTVTRWDDPAIRDLNAGMNLPSERIVVVRERGNSSTLALIENYLSGGLTWQPSSIRVMGPDELATTVRTTPYSIGYVDFSYAIQTRMTFAAMENSDGEFVLPSMESIEQAVNSSRIIQDFVGTDNPSDAIFAKTSIIGNTSYPITGLYYARLPGSVSNATIDFVEWIIDQDGGQRVLSEVQYPSIFKLDNSLTAYARAVINGTGPEAIRD
ncbi:MAG TPA: substrate-binding domain-containing protein [Nitrososphaera sp.]|nr:substrate-binding domain-containing protein [Nitrososphaera sp.]